MKNEFVANAEPVGLLKWVTEKSTGVLREFQLGRRPVILSRNESDIPNAEGGLYK
jgi:hypothetical protein